MAKCEADEALAERPSDKDVGEGAALPEFGATSEAEESDVDDESAPEGEPRERKRDRVKRLSARVVEESQAAFKKDGLGTELLEKTPGVGFGVAAAHALRGDKPRASRAATRSAASTAATAVGVTGAVVAPVVAGYAVGTAAAAGVVGAGAMVAVNTGALVGTAAASGVVGTVVKHSTQYTLEGVHERIGLEAVPGSDEAHRKGVVELGVDMALGAAVGVAAGMGPAKDATDHAAQLLCVGGLGGQAADIGAGVATEMGMDKTVEAGVGLGGRVRRGSVTPEAVPEDSEGEAEGSEGGSGQKTERDGTDVILARDHVAGALLTVDAGVHLMKMGCAVAKELGKEQAAEAARGIHRQMRRWSWHGSAEDPEEAKRPQEGDEAAEESSQPSSPRSPSPGGTDQASRRRRRHCSWQTGDEAGA